MGWAYCGQDEKGREIGYSVEAICDQEGCTAEIDRGLSYVCGNMHGGQGVGCGGYFCSAHLSTLSIRGEVYQLCKACLDEAPCPDGQHVWKGHQNPNTADEFGEWVCFCDVCGIEKDDD